MSLNAITTRQLKYLDDTLKDCSTIIHSAFVSRSVNDDLFSSGAQKIVAKDDCKLNPSDYYRFRCFDEEISIHYENHCYSVVFSGFTLDNLRKLFNYFSNTSSISFDDVKFDTFGSYSLIRPLGFDDAKTVFYNMCRLYCERKFDECQVLF